MPFGAAVLDDDRVRFALWAPSARTVELCLEASDGDSCLPMRAQDNGWFTSITEEAGAGTRYRYRIDGDLKVPDPASRYNPGDVHGPSEVVDPRAFPWDDEPWRGRPWESAIIYELHVGTFTPEGTFAAVEAKLDYLLDLGVTAIELMPLADFPGRRDWGYDGVLLFAPDASYGRPEDLKSLVRAAHRRGLMVLHDVVYNHFGPDGNFLSAYAAQFFTDRHQTPWGAGLNFDGPQSPTVRDFFVHNALYWLHEFAFDGLRFDAVHAILDDSRPDFLDELARRIRAAADRERQVHLVLENDDNNAHRLERQDGGVLPIRAVATRRDAAVSSVASVDSGEVRSEAADASAVPNDGRVALRYTAQWNDDFHHVMHCLVTGETDGYYADYAGDPVLRLGRCLTEGFAYQGEASPFRGGKARGSKSAHLPPTAFVAFLQNHDQIGNRAFGERLPRLASPAALTTATAILLLSPQPPLLFMGDEFAAATPFLFFCDFEGDLASAVRDGRRREFEGFAGFADPGKIASIPDPGADATFDKSKLDWKSVTRSPHAATLALYRDLLALRTREIVPLLPSIDARSRSHIQTGPRSLTVRWSIDPTQDLLLNANLGAPLVDGVHSPGRALYSTAATPEQAMTDAWSATWLLAPSRTRHG